MTDSSALAVLRTPPMAASGSPTPERSLRTGQGHPHGDERPSPGDGRWRTPTAEPAGPATWPRVVGRSGGVPPRRSRPPGRPRDGRRDAQEARGPDPGASARRGSPAEHAAPHLAEPPLAPIRRRIAPVPAPGRRLLQRREARPRSRRHVSRRRHGAWPGRRPAGRIHDASGTDQEDRGQQLRAARPGRGPLQSEPGPDPGRFPRPAPSRHDGLLGCSTPPAGR